MNGHILHGTSICVDYWLWTPEKKYIHFLSHLHSDRTYKLSSTFRGIVYTSPFNSWLVKRWFQIPPDRVVSLKVNEPHILPDGEGGYFNATLIDANHCPGSVMFLFEGAFGNILYTGDFCYTPKMLQNPMLKSLIDNQMVQELYLDNTFAAEQCKIPSREDALKQVIDLVKMHPDHYIVIGVSKVGKEEVLSAVAKALQEKILVSVDRMAILKQLHFENVFTTKSQESRILAKEIHLITGNFLFKLKEEKGPVLTILLTALHSLISYYQLESKINEDKLLGIYRIPHSDHSSHQELVEFVSKVRPHKIHPILCQIQNKNPTMFKHKYGDRDVPELSWSFHQIPEGILKLCRPSKVQRRIFPECLYESVSEVSNDGFGIGFSQITEDLSNDVLEIQPSQLLVDTSHLANTSLVNNLYQTNQLRMDAGYTTNTNPKEENRSETLEEQINQLSVVNHSELENITECLELNNHQLSKDKTISKTDKENAKETLENQPNHPTTDTTVTNTKEENILENLAELCDDSETQSDGKYEYISLSQEDLAQILTQPSTSNQVDAMTNSPTESSHANKNTHKNNYWSEEQYENPISGSEESVFISLSQEDLTKLSAQPSTSSSSNLKNNKTTEKTDDRKTKLKKKLVLDSDESDSSDLILNYANSNCNKEENPQIQCDKEIDNEVDNIESQVVTKEFPKSDDLSVLKNRPVLKESSETLVADLRESSHQSKLSETRKSVELAVNGKSKMSRVGTGAINKTHVSVNTFKEMSTLLKLIDQKRTVTSTPKSDKDSNPSKRSRTSYEFKSRVVLKSSTCLDTFPREQNERTAEKLKDNISDNSESNADLNSFLQALEKLDSNKSPEENGFEKILCLHSPVSDTHVSSSIQALDSRKYEEDIEDENIICQLCAVSDEESLVSSSIRAPESKSQKEIEDEKILSSKCSHFPMSNEGSSVTNISSNEETEDLYEEYRLVQNIVFYQDRLAERIGRRLSSCAVSMIANADRISAQWNKSIDETKKG